MGGGGREEGEGESRGVLNIMHGRSLKAIDPPIATNAETEHVGFSPTRQAYGAWGGTRYSCMAVVV